MIGTRRFRTLTLAVALTVVLVKGATDVPIFQSTGCPAEFLGRCRCGPINIRIDQFMNIHVVETSSWSTSLSHLESRGQVMYVTNCTDTGFKDASVLRQLPPETELLIFTGNDIRQIPPNVFGDEARYDRLVHVDLRRNNIVEIQGQAFHRVPNVRQLILDENAWRIDANHTRMFANMRALEGLYLNRAFDRRSGVMNDELVNLVRLLKGVSNETSSMSARVSVQSAITVLHLRGNRLGPYFKMDVFCDLPSLAEIDLSENDIVQVVWERQCLPRLHTLDLQRNLLHYLSNSTMEKLEVIADLTIDLAHNDFNCDCRALPFYLWIHSTDVHVAGREGYTCKDGYPETNAGRLMMTLPMELFQCEEPTNVLMLVPSFAFVHVALAVVVCLACVLLLAVVIAHRNSIANTFRNVGEPVYRRMQYSTIQKQSDSRELDV